MGRRRRRGERKARQYWVLGAALAGVMFIGPGLDVASLAWRVSGACKIWMVVDGDTVRAYCRGKGFINARLLGFDTPEMNGRCPKETAMAFAATYSLRWMLWTSDNSHLWLSGEEDRYGRALARLRLDGLGVSTALVNAGLARPYDGGRRKPWCGVAA